MKDRERAGWTSQVIHSLRTDPHRHQDVMRTDPRGSFTTDYSSYWVFVGPFRTHGWDLWNGTSGVPFLDAFGIGLHVGKRR